MLTVDLDAIVRRYVTGPLKLGSMGFDGIVRKLAIEIGLGDSDVGEWWRVKLIGLHRLFQIAKFVGHDPEQSGRRVRRVGRRKHG